MQSEQLLKSRIFTVERLSYSADGGQPLQRDVIRHPGSVAIVPLLPDGRVCLIKNHRVSVDRTLVEIPAGTMEPPEPALECAHRELIEETGYRAAAMKQVASFFAAPGILDEEMHLFVATELSPGKAAREPGEQIENLLVDFDEARSMILRGEIRDAKTIVGLLMISQLGVLSRDSA